MSWVADGVRVDRTLVADGTTQRVQYRLRSAASEALGFSLLEIPRDEDVHTMSTAIEGVISPGETLVLHGPPTDAAPPTDVELRLTTQPVPVAADGGQALESEGSSDSAPTTRPVPTHGHTDRPALGLVATAENEAQFSRAAARARGAGRPVYVAHAGTANPEALEFVERLGATLVTVPDLEPETISEALTDAARADEHLGIRLRTAGTDTTTADPTAPVLFETPQDDGQAHATSTAAARTQPVEGLTVIGIPAYNEAATIEGVVRAASSFADTVLVVDDGSHDETAALAERAGARVIRHGTNRGYGAALRSVFTEAAALGARSLAVVDADGQHDPAEIRSLLECQRETGADLVIGSRFVEGADTDMPRYRRFGVEVVNVLTNVAAARRGDEYIRDTQSGFRVYGRRAIESLANDRTIGAGMNASTDIVFHAARHGYDIRETPIDVRYDVANANTYNPVVHGVHLVANIVGHVVRRRPVESVGVPGVSSLVLGALVWAWVVFGTSGLSTGTVPLLGLAGLLVCCGVAGTIATLLLVFGGRHDQLA